MQKRRCRRGIAVCADRRHATASFAFRMVQIKKVKGDKKRPLEPLLRQIQKENFLEDPTEDDFVRLAGSRASRSIVPSQNALYMNGEDDFCNEDDEDAQNKESFLDEKTTRQILATSKIQQKELLQEGIVINAHVPAKHSASSNSSLYGNDEDSEDEEIECYDEASEQIIVSPEEQALLDQFEACSRKDSSKTATTLSSLIMEKIDALQNAKLTATSEVDATQAPDAQSAAKAIHPKVVEAYKKVGLILSRYKSGKLPKALKVIPALPNWEEILLLTEPTHWTPHSVFQATRLFASNLNAKMAERFYSVFLLPRFRVDMRSNEHRPISPHLYAALKKATYKPGAFYKGIIFPLVLAGDCTLREASVMASVLHKSTIPVLHSAAAIYQLVSAEVPFSGVQCVFLRTLLDKKYALPLRVIDSLCDFFVAFRTDSRTLPVLWHQALLVFVQRFKTDLTREQAQNLQSLIAVKHHTLISAECRREIAAATHFRGEPDPTRMQA